MTQQDTDPAAAKAHEKLKAAGLEGTLIHGAAAPFSVWSPEKGEYVTVDQYIADHHQPQQEA